MELPFALKHCDLETHAILPQEVLCRQAIVEEVFLSLYAINYILIFQDQACIDCNGQSHGPSRVIFVEFKFYCIIVCFDRVEISPILK